MLPGYEVARVEQLNHAMTRRVMEYGLHFLDPQRHALEDGPTLSNARDDYDRSVASREIGKLRIVGEEQQFLRAQPPANVLIRRSALAQHDDMLDVDACRAQAMVEGKREVLVEKDLHEARRTAGGKWAAM